MTNIERGQPDDKQGPAFRPLFKPPYLSRTERAFRGAGIYVDPREAERMDRKERALRQKTIGIVYFVGFKDRVKVGFTTHFPNRLSALRVSSSERLEVFLTIKGTLATEKKLHKKFAKYRLEGEWFWMVPAILSFIERRKPLK